MARSSDSNPLFSLLRDKSFQAHEIRRVIKLSAIYLLVTTCVVGVFYYFMLGNLIEGVAPMLFVSEDIALVNDVIPSLSSVIGQWILVMLAVNLVLTAALAIYITRKLGQPILAIRRALREIGSGNLDVRLRSSDSKEFGEITTELNLAIHSIRKQVATAQQSVKKAQFLSEQTPDSPKSEVDDALGECNGALDFFQIQDGLHQQVPPSDGNLNGSARVA